MKDIGSGGILSRPLAQWLGCAIFDLGARIALVSTTPAFPFLSSTSMRFRIYGIVRGEPGISVREASKRAGLSVATVNYHVDRLVEADLLCRRRSGRRCFLYASEPPLEESDEARGLLEEPTCRRIALAIIGSPYGGITRLIGETGCSQRAVYYHVKRLLEVGLITTAQGRGYRQLVPTSRLYGLLIERVPPLE